MAPTSSPLRNATRRSSPRYGSVAKALSFALGKRAKLLIASLSARAKLWRPRRFAALFRHPRSKSRPAKIS
ncbi:hypothetical protein H5410_056568 [Solanum commersonii]|uniref:Uncharacterized protein n=1 Tax=Solanum commersonii TaxID=4109 RepID=A0A9J5WLN9_SOLCO|nr:hypothetical protein H5410_056568 [Solanum commersonii]